LASLIVLDVNTHRLTESDFPFDVILSRWWSWCHFTQKSGATWWMLTQRMEQRPRVPDL